MLLEYNSINEEFSVRRVRFTFRAENSLVFQPGRAANLFRGALGWYLSQTEPDAYAEFFEPRQAPGSGPSGFANRTRPFVFRAHHLDGATLAPADTFSVDLHLFRDAPEDVFIEALGSVSFATFQSAILESFLIPLRDPGGAIDRLKVYFLTPTELKSEGGMAPLPEFPVLFSRACDRVRALSMNPLSLDLPDLAARASAIALDSHTLTRHRRQRTSRKTGQSHPIGGFTGEASYRGPLAEYLPILRAACWTGVGRQTVWGKGALQLDTDDGVGEPAA